MVPDTSHMLEELRADLAKIEASVNLDVKASVDAAELTASAREAVAEAQALAGDIDVKANVDSSQVAQLEGVLRGAGSGVSGLVSSFGILAGAAGALGLALIPLLAVIGGLAAALAAPLAVTAGGVTVFGFLAGFAAKQTLEQLKAIEKQREKLAGLTKGTKEYRDANADLKVLLGGLTPAQKHFADALDNLKNAFDAIPKGVLLKPLTDAMKLLAALLPALKPIVAAVSGVFADMIGSLGDVVSSPGFKGFVKGFAHDLARDLKILGKIIGNLFVGLGGLFGALDDQLSQGVLKGILNLSKRFADFGRDAKKNEGLRSFVDYVKQNLPKVGEFIGNAFAVIGAAIGALAPAGTLVLDALNGILGAVRNLKDLAGPLAATLAGFGLGAFFGGPQVGLAVAAVTALAFGFRHLWENSKPLRDVVGDLGDFFRDKLLPYIKRAAEQIIPAAKDAVKDFTDTIREHKGLIETFGKVFLTIASASVISAILSLVAAIKLIGAAFKFGVKWVQLWADGTLTIFSLILKGLAALVATVLNGFGSIVDGAATAFGWMPGIGDKVKAAQKAFHGFTDNVVGDILGVSDKLLDLKNQIDEVGDMTPTFKVTAQTLEATRDLEALQAFRLKDKSFTVRVEQEIDRVVGPGGGMGRPTGSAGGGAGSGGSGAGLTVNIENATVGDTNDLLRKSADAVRARAGGGVSLVPGPTASFAGAF